MKLIGLDVGTKRIGVAKADTDTRIAVPDGFIIVNGQEFSEIARTARLYNTATFVVGLPRNNNGMETQQSAYVRNFARQLAMVIPNAKIFFQDESLTSVEAERRLKARKKNYQKGEIDAESASIILQDCIEHYDPSTGRIDSTNPYDPKDPANSEAAWQAAGYHNPDAMAAQSAIKMPNQDPAAQQTAQAAGTAAAQPATNQLDQTIENGAHMTNADKKAAKKAAKAARKATAKHSGHNKKVGLYILCVFLGLLVVAGIAGVICYNWYQGAVKPVKEVSCKYSTANEAAASDEADMTEGCTFEKFDVKDSQTVDVIARNLVTAGLIKNDFAFKIYTKLNNNANQLKSGSYDFRPAMSVADIVDLLVKGAGDTNVFNFTILPGETISDVKKKLLDLGYGRSEVNAAFEKNYSANEVLKGLYDVNGNLQNNLQPRDVQLEGYIYGETYQFYIGETPEKIISRTMDELNEVIKGNDLEAKFAARGLTLREGIILASIVQKEAKTADMAGVAMVFENRLRLGMALGSDVTASYAADLYEAQTGTALTDNAAILALDSPYNTRLYPGLTPGPICSPSITALLAVAAPDTAHEHDLYFLTGDDGQMYYGRTEEDHQRNIRDYCQVMCAVAL